MKKPRHHSDEKTQQEVAYLTSRGYQNRQIAILLDWNEPETCVAKKEAVSRGWLEAAPRFAEDRVSRERFEELQMLDWPYRLSRPLHDVAAENRIAKHRRVRHIRVFHSGSQATSPEGWNTRLSRFSASAAPALLGVLLKSQIAGVTWGRTIASAIEAIAKVDPAALKPRGPRRFVATSGEPFGTIAKGISSSSVVEQLDALQSGDGTHAATLRGVPALIPPQFNKMAILEFLGHHTSFGTIFGIGAERDRAQVLISRLDTLITSVGTFDQTGSMYTTELEEKWSISKSELKKLAHGDIGGALIPRDEDGPLPPKASARFEEIAAMSTGITRDDFVKLADRTAAQPDDARKQLPGIVLIAIGSNKARIVYEAVRRGLATELLIDHDLAAALGDLCNTDMQSPLRPDF